GPAAWPALRHRRVRGLALLRPAARPGGVPPRRARRALVPLGGAVLHGHPLFARAAARGDARASGAQWPALLLHPPDRLPRLRLDGPEPARLLRRRDDRLLGVGRIPRRGGRLEGRAGEGLLVAADRPRLA